jgi:hypothetical protein
VKHLIAALALLVGMTPLARADDAAAVRALAEQGDANAQFVLGTMYRDGQGVAQDHTEALRWWGNAAELGVVDAQFALGNLYAGGAGIAPDDIQAYMWYDIAALQTGEDWLHAIAGSNRDALAKRMTPADLAQAQRQAEEWRAKYGQ